MGNGPKTPLGLRNGVYEFNLRELTPSAGDLCGEEAPGSGDFQPVRIPLAENDPYSDAHVSQQDEDGDVAVDGDVKDGVDDDPESCEICAPKYQAPVKTIKDPCLT